MGRFYRLITEFYNSGKITALVEPVQVEDEMPDIECKETYEKDVYTEYFETREEAMHMLKNLGENYTLL